jgi:hypothetical protein
MSARKANEVVADLSNTADGMDSVKTVPFPPRVIALIWSQVRTRATGAWPWRGAAAAAGAAGAATFR